MSWPQTRLLKAIVCIISHALYVRDVSSHPLIARLDSGCGSLHLMADKDRHCDPQKLLHLHSFQVALGNPNFLRVCFIVATITVSPFPLHFCPAPPRPPSLWPSPHCHPCPWVRYALSLADTIPFLPRSDTRQSLHVSVPLFLFYSSAYFVH